jgi:hypothetical protein
MKWCDLLRVKSEHPINLWPNGVQAYHRWIHDRIAQNKPYDQFVRQLLVSSGSNFRQPAVNFYRAVQGAEPAAIAAAVGLTFMGVRLDQWPADRRAGMERLFSHLAFKGTAEWKEEIVHVDPTPRAAFEATLPDGTSVHVGPDSDPRVAFADWLITADNPWFTRNIANRVWAWLMGRGIAEPIDDLRDDRPPLQPQLLAHLQQELVKASYDLKHLYRQVLNSRTYQQSPIRRSDHLLTDRLFASYPVRRLEAEVLIDALVSLFGSPESYTSPIPEPFTFIPQWQRAIELADGSITSPFLDLFGRPPRDTGLESERNNSATDAQLLYLVNSSQLQQRLERSAVMRQLTGRSRSDRDQIIDGLYLRIVSRAPTDAERQTAMGYLEPKGAALRLGAVDLAWALINTKEFLYRH